MCIIHKGLSGFGTLSPASILGDNLIGLKPAIPYEIIVCREVEHRQNKVLHAVIGYADFASSIEMVEFASWRMAHCCRRAGEGSKPPKDY